MVNIQHLGYLSGIIDELNGNSVEGAIVECGVWKGGCVMWMLHCQKRSSCQRPFYLYDTFEGMTAPTSVNDAIEAKQIYDRISSKTYRRDYDAWHGENKWAYAPIEYVKANIEKADYDPAAITYVKGDVLTTLDQTLPAAIAILRLDTDWYDSTKKELEVLFPLVSSGGYIIVDDYYAWKGSKVATDEFFQTIKGLVKVINVNLTGGMYVLRKN